MRVYNQRKLKQLCAINYAYARKREEEARRLMAKCKELGLKIKQSAYAQITINRCNDALREFYELIENGAKGVKRILNGGNKNA